MSLMGIHVYRLEGGFRAHRQWVIQALEEPIMIPPALCYMVIQAVVNCNFTYSQRAGFPCIGFRRVSRA